MTNNQQKLIDLLKEMFQFDQSDLDFGIYRIMNLKRDEINDYLNNKLPQEITDGINALVSTENEAKIKKLKEQIESTKNSSLPEGIRNQAVSALEEKLKTIKVDTSDIEGDVYNRLADFFSRYYDEGDFISQRRYKDGVYAIPYEGEEVKLYWANYDQYYVKTSENFTDYTFKTKYGDKVMFKVVDAEVERDNNKSSDKKFFCLHDEKHFEITDDTLVIYIEYRNAEFKKQEEANHIIFETIKNELRDQRYTPLFTPPSSKEKSEFEKQLYRYTAKNTFDYFIHKDLGKFLRRELDFYIKNEVIYLDDIQITDMAKTKEYLVKAQVIKNVANKIIDFLAQIEDFQKKMYLKKKLVVSTNYCITLDRIPEKMYPEIIQNDEQRKEWVKLFAIDEIKAENIQSLFEQQKVGYTEPLTIEFLKQNPYLVLDTKFFSDDFKERLVESIDDLDENTNGLLVSSENFQFLNLVQKRYVQEFDTIYIDPPYNTDASEILYKNNYKDSSWMTLIANRLQISRNLLKPNGISITTIDEWELKELYGLLEEEFGKNLNAGIIAIRINPSGRPRDGGLALAHEYALFFRNSYLAVIGKFGRSDEQMSRYNKSDERGPFEQRNFRREGSNSDRFDGIRQWYPFFVNQSNLSLRIPKIKWNDAKKDYDILEKPSESEIIIYPITDEGVEKNWRWAWENVVKDYSQFYAIKQKSGFQIYYKFRPNNEGISPLTFWDDKKYSATEQGTKMLKNMLPENTFAYPKSLYAVEDCIKIANGWKKDALVLDYFAGSGTTAHSVIELNRADNGTRKYVLCEMGEYFNTITKPRVEKAIYSKEWKQGKPIARDGISQCFKYMKLESYEDSLNNIKFNNSLEQIPDGLKEEYLLKYMINMETKESMFNVDKLAHPFNYVMDITQKQETKKTVMDIVESFNYLIGLVVERSYAKKSYDATFTNGEYGVLEAHISDGTTYTLKLIEGHSLSGDKILVIWRDMTDDIAKDNAVLDAVLAKKVITVDEFDRIYVNGDNNLNNTNGNKVFLIEDEMRKRMFED